MHNTVLNSLSVSLALTVGHFWPLETLCRLKMAAHRMPNVWVVVHFFVRSLA